MNKKEITETTELFTTGQVARLCGVSVVTVWRWIRGDKLKAQTTPGRHHRVRRKDLVKFLVDHRMVVPSALAKKKK